MLRHTMDPRVLEDKPYGIKADATIQPAKSYPMSLYIIR
ncbi:hypothetical Protein YC6258_03577 [Gynuella sunshinyii YC6258]|uniref:Uncharacterized protein n=1 Tax=Gynuella sunshinyii YC6258 TaxID=1445510 RepID=A0A0C5VQA5_9GAMM|nr:hypothetical Protein YC6258_03577 [Gynuella sunshinyii YC6258]